MQLDLSTLPTGALLPLLILSLVVALVAWRVATPAYKRSASSPMAWAMILLGGVGIFVAIATAVEFWLVRG